MNTTIAHIIETAYRRCYESGSFESIHEINDESNTAINSIFVSPNALGLPEIRDDVQIDGLTTTQELVIGQSHADALMIHFEVSAKLPKACPNNTLILELVNRIHDRRGVGRVSVDFVKRTWKCHAQIDFFGFDVSFEKGSTSNHCYLSSPEIECSLSTLMGVFDTARQFQKHLEAAHESSD